MAFALDAMDPFQHLLLPLLLLLALRIDSRKTLLFAPLAIIPDFDALIGLHRELGHSFIPIIIAPVLIIAYARFRRPEWLLSALIVQFYLASHVILDLGGVAFLWPFVPEQFYFEPGITFGVDGGLDFALVLNYGWREMPDMGTTSFLSETGAALLLLGVLLAVVFRTEARKAISQVLSFTKERLMCIAMRLR
ncbi:MAG: metal-dependent hydrolase [Methanobacteriota archaeon]|nr:MAG: metal-dependent hydrolase [Euryarchaeota archaeon]